MAGSVATKCPICGLAVAVGLVSGTLIQHDDKHGERCEGAGMDPVLKAEHASRGSGGTRSTSARGAGSGGSSGGGSSTRGATSKPRAASTSPAVKRGVTVRRVEVDHERLREREEKQERLRLEREARARARNEFYRVEVSVPIDDDEPVDDAVPVDESAPEGQPQGDEQVNERTDDPTPGGRL